MFNKKRRVFLEAKLKSNRGEMTELIRKIGRYDLDVEHLDQLDLMKIKIKHVPPINLRVFEYEESMIQYLTNLFEQMTKPLPRVIEYYLDIIMELLDKRNSVNKEDEKMFNWKKKNKLSGKRLSEDRDLKLKTTIITYEAKITDVIAKMNVLIEKGKNPKIKRDSFEFRKLERDYIRLEDDLKTYEEVISELYETVNQNNKIANIETIKEALDIAKKYKSRTFEQATELVSEVQVERNLAAEEKTKFKELSQQFKEGAPEKPIPQKSTFAEKLEETKVEDLKEAVEKSNEKEKMISEEM